MEETENKNSELPEEQNKPRVLENPVNLQFKQQQAATSEQKPQKQGFLKKLKRFWIECKRVLRVTKKPDSQEFKLIVKISGVGMAIIGVIGFLIHFLKEIIIR